MEVRDSQTGEINVRKCPEPLKGVVMAKQTESKTESRTESKTVNLTQASARKFARQTFGDDCLVTKTREVGYRYRILIPGADGQMIIVASSLNDIPKAIEQATVYADKNPKSRKESK